MSTDSGRPERRTARPHVDAVEEAAEDAGRAGPDQLRHGDAGERLGDEERQPRSQRHGCRRAGEQERRDGDRLARTRRSATSVSTISPSQTSGLFGLTMPIDHRALGERFRAAGGDGGEREPVTRLVSARAVDDERAVAPAQDRVVHLEVSRVVVEVLGLGGPALQERQRVARVSELHQLDVVGDRPVAPAALAVMGERRAADRRVHEAAAADAGSADRRRGR